MDLEDLIDPAYVFNTFGAERNDKHLFRIITYFASKIEKMRKFYPAYKDFLVKKMLKINSNTFNTR